MRVQALNYHFHDVPPLPGLLVAVGVISIMVGLISLVTGCSGVVQSLTFNTLATALAAAQNAAQASVVPQPILPRIANMTEVEQQIVVTAFAGRQPMTGRQVEMLNLLLSQAGDRLFAFAGESNINLQSVDGAIRNSGTVTAADGMPGVSFVLTNGRIEVRDDDAVFSPPGLETSVRVYRNQLGNLPPSTLSNQGGFFTVNVTNAGSGPATTQNTVALVAPPATAATRNVVIFSGVTSFISMVMAIWLLVAAILLLLRKRAGRTMHVMYAWLRIPIVILGSIASYNMTLLLYAAMPAFSTAPYMLGLVAGQTIFWLVIGCVYPVALLIVMRTRTVRDFYTHLTAK